MSPVTDIFVIFCRSTCGATRTRSSTSWRPRPAETSTASRSSSRMKSRTEPSRTLYSEWRANPTGKTKTETDWNFTTQYKLQINTQQLILNFIDLHEHNLLRLACWNQHCYNFKIFFKFARFFTQTFATVIFFKQVFKNTSLYKRMLERFNLGIIFLNF